MTDTFASARGQSCARPWPWEPIGSALAKQGAVSGHDFAQALGCGRSTVTRAIEKGLTDQQADQWAVALGKHPSELFGWDAWWRPAITERDDRHVNGPGLGWRQAWEWAESLRGGELAEAA